MRELREAVHDNGCWPDTFDGCCSPGRAAADGLHVADGHDPAEPEQHAGAEFLAKRKFRLIGVSRRHPSANVVAVEQRGVDVQFLIIQSGRVDRVAAAARRKWRLAGQPDPAGFREPGCLGRADGHRRRAGR